MSYAPKLIFKTFALLLAVGLMLPAAHPVHGQGEVTVEEPDAAIKFGETITFHAKIKSTQPIKGVMVIFQGANQETTYAKDAQLSEDGLASFTYAASLNLFPPFSMIMYRFQVTLEDGQVYTSENSGVLYEDNRFPWNQVTRANVTVHWWAGDPAIASKAHDMAAAAMIKMAEFFNVSFTDPIHIYIYSNAIDLQNTLMFGGKPWVGGHALPEIGAALVAIPPDAPISEYQKKIPHEVAHLLLYRALGRKYNNQPTWLVEGIASVVEQYPDPEYKRALDDASSKDALIPFTKLCSGFPPDSGGAYLAYAQSQSFVKYIYESYGASGLSRLIGAYSDGMTCEPGAAKALGVSLSQLDVGWRETVLGQNVIGVAARNLSPFVLIMALVLIVPLWGMIDLLRQRKKREEKYAKKPTLK